MWTWRSCWQRLRCWLVWRGIEIGREAIAPYVDSSTPMTPDYPPSHRRFQSPDGAHLTIAMMMYWPIRARRMTRLQWIGITIQRVALSLPVTSMGWRGTKTEFLNDVHLHTLIQDPVFHTFMDALHPGWNAWELRRQRDHAKMWNFSSLYGTRHPSRLFSELEVQHIAAKMLNKDLLVWDTNLDVERYFWERMWRNRNR